MHLAIRRFRCIANGVPKRRDFREFRRPFVRESFKVSDGVLLLGIRQAGRRGVEIALQVGQHCLNALGFRFVIFNRGAQIGGAVAELRPDGLGRAASDGGG
jgi:hypothetical protein